MITNVKLDLIMALIILLGIAIILGLIIPFFLFDSNLGLIIGSLIGFVTTIVFFILLFYLQYSLKFSYRLVITDNLLAKEAFKQGISVLKKNGSKAFKLIFANCLVSSLVMMGILAIIAGVVISLGLGLTSGASEGNSSLISILLFLTAIFGIPLFLVFIFLFQAFGGFLRTYDEFTWSNLYLFIQENLNTDDIAPVPASPPPISQAPPAINPEPEKLTSPVQTYSPNFDNSRDQKTTDLNNNSHKVEENIDGN